MQKESTKGTHKWYKVVYRQHCKNVWLAGDFEGSEIKDGRAKHQSKEDYQKQGGILQNVEITYNEENQKTE